VGNLLGNCSQGKPTAGWKIKPQREKLTGHPKYEHPSDVHLEHE